MHARSRIRFEICRERAIARRWVVLLCLVWSCGHAGEVGKLDAAEGDAVALASPVFRHEAFSFRDGPNWLVGDLGLPDGPPPYPAVVFVHGSGAASRHSDYYDSIADEFLGRGFATLIWSKPGVDESTGDYLKQSMAARANEVAAAMRSLAERPDIERDRIGLWGISQAGWVMPMVPAHRKVAFVISVSSPGRTGEEQDLYGLEHELVELGLSEDDRADALDHRRQLYKLIRQSADYAEFTHRHQEWVEAMKRRPWYPAVESRPSGLFFLDFGFAIDRRHFEFISINLADEINRLAVAPPQLEKLNMPVLAIYGGKDAIVDPHAGAEAYAKIPRINGNPDVTVKLFEDADHAIRQPGDEGQLDFAPGFLTTMGEWLAEHR